MIKLDPSIVSSYGWLATPPTHARLFHRTIRVSHPYYQPSSQWFSLNGAYIQAAYLLGTVDSASGAFTPLSAQCCDPVLVLIDSQTAINYGLLSPGASPNPYDPTNPFITTGKPSNDCRILDIDAVTCHVCNALKGTVVEDPPAEVDLMTTIITPTENFVRIPPANS